MLALLLEGRGLLSLWRFWALHTRGGVVGLNVGEQLPGSVSLCK